MKFSQFLSHPLLQVISFCIILVGSPYFGGPYGFFIYRALLEGYTFAIIGITAILLTLLSIFFPLRGYIQLVGLLLMIISLGVFFLSSQNFMNASTLKELIPLLSFLFFITVVVFVSKTTITHINANQSNA
jgi:hypothetical protein